MEKLNKIKASDDIEEEHRAPALKLSKSEKELRLVNRNR